MKHSQKILLIFLMFSLLLMIGCSNAAETERNEPKETDQAGGTLDKPINDPIDKETVTKTPKEEMEQPDEATDQPRKKEPKIKYYISKNYLIKPVNSDDPDKVVLLTFDDAPQGEVTTDILDILDKYEAKAIFFVNGHYVVKHKALLEEIYNRGHFIGNHTWWHENLKKINMEKTKSEIIDVNDLIEEMLGIRPTYFRPPFGVMSEAAKEVIKAEKMQSMNWSLGSLDWEYTKPEQAQLVVDQVVNNVYPGANILMHDKIVTSLVLDPILSKLKEKGYAFVLPTEVYLED